jgi:hypothetical protein
MDNQAWVLICVAVWAITYVYMDVSRRGGRK